MVTEGVENSPHQCSRMKLSEAKDGLDVLYLFKLQHQSRMNLEIWYSFSGEDAYTAAFGESAR